MTSTITHTNVVRLRKNEQRRIIHGHAWVFANEIASVEGVPDQGAIVAVQDAAKNSLGVGMYNKTSLIAVRMLSRAEEPIDTEFFAKRLDAAAHLREHLFPGAKAYRMVHGESDFLPGLTIDRFGDCFAIQILCAGMQRFQDVITELLVQRFNAKGVIAKNDSHLRTLEGLDRETHVLYGDCQPVRISDGVVTYDVDIAAGQKTGFYYDQRENRAALSRFSNGARVLDCYCNSGGFALHAALAGADEAIGIDSSAQAIAAATRNTALNGGTSACTFIETDVEKQLKHYAENNESFDVVVLDPPAFAKNKKSTPAALRAYRALNSLALLLVTPGGILATATCSHHITRDMFSDVIAASASQTHRRVQILERRGSSPDHPVLPAMPETEYLQFFICRAL